MNKNSFLRSICNKLTTPLYSHITTLNNNLKDEILLSNKNLKDEILLILKTDLKTKLDQIGNYTVTSAMQTRLLSVPIQPSLENINGGVSS